MKRLSSFASLLGLLVASPVVVDAQTLFNGAGSTFTITDSVVYVVGPVTNQGTLRTQAGRLLVDQGDFVNTGDSRPGLGRVRLDGGASGRTVTLSGDTLHRLDLNVPANTTLGSDGVIKGALALISGHLLTTTGFQLRLGPAAVVANESSSHYVKGALVQQKTISGASAVDFGQMGFLVNPAGQTITLQVDRRSGLNTLNYSYGHNPNVLVNEGIDRIWRLSTPGGVDPASAVTATLSWLSDNDHGLDFTSTLAQVWRSDDNGATWIKQGTPMTGASRTLTVPLTDLNAWYTVSTVDVPLPMQLISFDAQAHGLDANLAWRTASEHNSAWFVVERATDGKTWKEVNRTRAAGQSQQTREYAATDAGAGRVAPAFYYRLRQLDQDGATAFSDIRLVRFQAPTALTVEAYPIPLQHELTLDATTPDAGKLLVAIFDATGRQVLREEVDAQVGLNTWRIPTSKLAEGTYSLRATLGQQTRTVRLVK